MVRRGRGKKRLEKRRREGGVEEGEKGSRGERKGKLGKGD